MDKCFFKTKQGCSATTYTDCPACCAFQKSKDEHNADIVRAKQLLERKGLSAVEKSIGGRRIVTVVKAGGMNDTGRKN